MTNNLTDALEETNKWWKTKFEIEFKPRDIFKEINHYVSKKQIIALTGLRRVGKTTILFKIIQDNISEYGKENIIYFSFDDYKEVKLKEILNEYGRLQNRDINKGKYLVLFDEIQKLNNWEEQLKRIYDNYGNIKIIISGSESLFIRKKSRESLAGRFYEFQIKPLTFKEFLKFKGKNYSNLELYKEEILREFNNYLYSSGFPEMINEDKQAIKKYIKENIIEKIVYQDLPQVFPVREPAVIGSILNIIMLDPGQMFNLDDLSKTTGVSRQTISLYLDYLEKAFLIRKLYNYSKNARKTQRKLKKYYPTIISPELIEKQDSTGKVFETAVVLYLDAEYFWRDTYKNEVDAIKIEGSNIMPIEIKHSKPDSKALKLFMNKYDIKKGMIITYQAKDTIKLDGKEINVVPFYEFCLTK